MLWYWDAQGALRVGVGGGLHKKYNSPSWVESEKASWTPQYSGLNLEKEKKQKGVRE